METMVAGIKLEHPVMNAAGTCKSFEDVEKLSRSATAAIMVGSITVEPRSGNNGEVFYPGEGYSLNSLGLPNRGMTYYKEHLPRMAAWAHGAGKPLFVSVAGFSPEEYGILAEVAFQGGADLVELNLGCPNVWQGSLQKRIVCFDPEMVADVHLAVARRVGYEARISDKISPYSDPFALAEFTKVAMVSMVPKVLTTCNTFPNAFAWCGIRSCITPGGGLSAMAGSALKPIGLGQVTQLRNFLPNMELIGAGGVSTGQDVRDYCRSGTVVVQIATAYLKRGPQIFSDILHELTDEVKV